MKSGTLCLLLLLTPACSFLEPSHDPEDSEYALTWYCISPEGCEHAEELSRIDGVTLDGYYDFYFTSSQDPSFSEKAERLITEVLPVGCSWLYFLMFLGHDLERSMLCSSPGGFELELSIPNDDLATYSQWVVSGRKL